MSQFSEKVTLWRRFIIWRYKNISGKQFIYFLAIIIGLISGMVSTGLKWVVHIITKPLEDGFIGFYHHAYFFLFPIVGLLIVYFIKHYLIRQNIEDGVPIALYALGRRKGMVEKFHTFASFILAPITVSFGGSVGLEAPAVVTSSAISSNLAQWFRMDEKTRKLLLVCGAAASLSAIFKAPLAAIVFAIEVFSLDLTLSSLMPLLISSITAIITRLFFSDEKSYLINFHLSERAFQLNVLPYYLLLGVITAVVSVYFVRMFYATKDATKKIKSPLLHTIIGGSILGIIIYFIPSLYGEGFETINTLISNHKPVLTSIHSLQQMADLHQWKFIALLFLIILIKPIATSITLNSGGIGGIFGPTIFIGTFTGNFFGHLLNKIGLVHVSVSNFTLLGACGLMAGVLHAPLTAIFLIAEITGGYNLFIPLMIISAISFGISRYFNSYSIYTKELAQKGDLVTHNKNKTILSALEVEHTIENNFIPVTPEMTLGDMLKKVVVNSSRNLFPVVGENKAFLGIVFLDDVRPVMFDQLVYDKMTVTDFMQKAPEVIFLEEDSAADIMAKFEQSNAWNLPVVKHDRYVGFISRSKLLTIYREYLVAHFDD